MFVSAIILYFTKQALEKLRKYFLFYLKRSFALTIQILEIFFLLILYGFTKKLKMY